MTDGVLIAPLTLAFWMVSKEAPLLAVASSNMNYAKECDSQMFALLDDILAWHLNIQCTMV